jgi:hypothetical protein
VARAGQGCTESLADVARSDDGDLHDRSVPFVCDDLAHAKYGLVMANIIQHCLALVNTDFVTA